MPRAKLKAFDPYNSNLKQKANYAKLQSRENKTVFDLPPDRQVGAARKRKRSAVATFDGTNERLSRSERSFQEMLAAANKKPKQSNNQPRKQSQSKKSQKADAKSNNKKGAAPTAAELAQAASEAELKPIVPRHILHPSNKNVKAAPEVNFNSRNQLIAPNPNLDRMPEPLRFQKDKHPAQSSHEPEEPPAREEDIDIDDEQYDDEDLSDVEQIVDTRAKEFAGVDHVMFGEVVDRPPTLTRVRGAPTERVRVPETVRQMLGQAAPQPRQAAAPSSAIERARIEAVAAYNKLREKRRADSQLKFADLQDRRKQKVK